MYGRLYLWLVRRLQLIMDNIYPKIAYMGEKAKSLSLFLFGFLENMNSFGFSVQNAMKAEEFIIW